MEKDRSAPGEVNWQDALGAEGLVGAHQGRGEGNAGQGANQGLVNARAAQGCKQ